MLQLPFSFFASQPVKLGKAHPFSMLGNSKDKFTSVPCSVAVAHQGTAALPLGRSLGAQGGRGAHGVRWGSSHQHQMALRAQSSPFLSLAEPGTSTLPGKRERAVSCTCMRRGKTAPFTVILPFSHFRVLCFAGTLSRLYLSE